MTPGFARFTCLSLATLLLCGFRAVILDAQERPSGTHDILAVVVTSDVTGEDNGPTVENDPRAPQFRGRQLNYGFATTVTYDGTSHREGAGQNGISQNGSQNGIIQNGFNQNNVGFQLSATSGVTRYTSLGEWLPSGNVVNARGSFKLGSSTAVTLGGSGGYIPGYAVGFVPVSTGPGSALGPFSPLDYAVDRRPLYSYGASANLAQRFGKNSSLSLDYVIQRVDFVDAVNPSWTSANANLGFTQQLSARSSVSLSYALQRSDFVNELDPSFTAMSANARFLYRFAKNTGVHFGYGRRQGDYDSVGNRLVSHIDDIDVGLDYNRALSLSRRTTVALGSGSSLYSEFGQQHFVFTGTATLNRAIGRDGHISVSYNRGFGFVEGFNEPVFSDSVAANVYGRVGSRVQLGMSLGYGLGEVTQPESSSAYRAWNGSGRFGFALANRALLNVDYIYYQHHIGDAYELLRAAATQEERQVLRVSISFRSPILTERVRRVEKGTK